MDALLEFKKRSVSPLLRDAELPSTDAELLKAPQGERERLIMSAPQRTSLVKKVPGWWDRISNTVRSKETDPYSRAALCRVSALRYVATGTRKMTMGEKKKYIRKRRGTTHFSPEKPNHHILILMQTNQFLKQTLLR